MIYELNSDEEQAIGKMRWDVRVAQAKIQHETHSLTQTDECCRILALDEMSGEDK